MYAATVKYWGQVMSRLVETGQLTDARRKAMAAALPANATDVQVAEAHVRMVRAIPNVDPFAVRACERLAREIADAGIDQDEADLADLADRW